VSASCRFARAAHDPALNVSAPLNSALLSSAPHVSAPPQRRGTEQVLSNTGDRQAMVAAFIFEIGSPSNVLRISVGDKHMAVVERYSFFV